MSPSVHESGHELQTLLLLDELERHGNVSQRRLAERLGRPVSLINQAIRRLIDARHIRIEDRNVRPFAYRLTTEGEAYRRRLSHDHYRSVLGSFRQVKARIARRLEEVRAQGATRLVFYGAGDVMEATCPLADEEGLSVVGLVDDDPEKQGAWRGGLVIRPPAAIVELEPDAVLITTFRHAAEIRERVPEEVRERVTIFEL